MASPETYSNIRASVISARKITVRASDAFQDLGDASNIANYSINTASGVAIPISSLVLQGDRTVFITTITDIPLGIPVYLNFAGILEIFGNIPLSLYSYPLVRVYRPLTVTVPVSSFSGVIGSQNPELFFSPALENPAPLSSIGVGDVSVCVDLTDTYKFTVPVDPTFFFLWSSPVPGLLGNTSTTLAGGHWSRYVEATFLFHNKEEDEIDPLVDEGGNGLFVEQWDPSYIALLNNSYWTIEGTGVEPVPFICADTLGGPIPPGATTGPFPLLSVRLSGRDPHDIL